MTTLTTRELEMISENASFNFAPTSEGRAWIKLTHNDGYKYFIRNIEGEDGENLVILFDNFSVTPVVIAKMPKVSITSLSKGSIEENLTAIYDANLLARSIGSKRISQDDTPIIDNIGRFLSKAKTNMAYKAYGNFFEDVYNNAIYSSQEKNGWTIFKNKETGFTFKVKNIKIELEDFYDIRTLYFDEDSNKVYVLTDIMKDLHRNIALLEQLITEKEFDNIDIKFLSVLNATDYNELKDIINFK